MRLIKNKNLVCEPFIKSNNVKEINYYSKIEDALEKFNYSKDEEQCKMILQNYLSSKTYSKQNIISKDAEEKCIAVICNQNIEKIRLQQKVNKLYSDIQLYQSKIDTQYNYSAIGEMTTGIAEEILNPLQIIMSYADIVEGEGDTCPGISSKIKAQVYKIEQMVQSLLKYAAKRPEPTKLHVINISNVLEETFNVFKSSLLVNKIETVFDLDDNVPPILSNKIYLGQIITNIFSIILNSGNHNEGLLLQLKNEGPQNSLRIIFTANLDKEKSINEFNILNRLLKKHEGNMIANFQIDSGSIIDLKFPVVRKG